MLLELKGNLCLRNKLSKKKMEAAKNGVFRHIKTNYVNMQICIHEIILLNGNIDANMIVDMCR